MADNDDSDAAATFGHLRNAILNGTLSLAKAMEIVNAFADGVRDKLPDDKWWRLKASLSEFVLACQAAKEESGAQNGTVAPGTYIKSVQEDVEVPLWEAIKRHLPDGMITPENVDKHAWNIGFLVGLGAETATAKVLRKMGIIP